MILFRKMPQIFKSKFLEKEFKEFYQDIIPNLNNCNSCGILKCRCCFVFQYNCSMCHILRCKNCQLFKNSRDLLFEKCSIDQWHYVVNFVRDLFHVSNYSVLRYNDLKPISQQVKDKNEVFLSKKDSENYLNKTKNNNNNNNDNNNNNNNKKSIL